MNIQQLKQVMLEGRKKVCDDFNNIFAKVGYRSISVGLSQDGDRDALIITSKYPQNLEVQDLFERTLLKPHTIQNLKSVGFRKIIVEASGNIEGSIDLTQPINFR